MCVCQKLLRARRELQASIAAKAVQSDRLVFQEQALSALHQLLSEDAVRYRQEIQRLRDFTGRLSGNMQGKSEYEQDNNMVTSPLIPPPRSSCLSTTSISIFPSRIPAPLNPAPRVPLPGMFFIPGLTQHTDFS